MDGLDFGIIYATGTSVVCTTTIVCGGLLEATASGSLV